MKKFFLICSLLMVGASVQAAEPGLKASAKPVGLVHQEVLVRPIGIAQIELREPITPEQQKELIARLQKFSGGARVTSKPLPTGGVVFYLTP